MAKEINADVNNDGTVDIHDVNETIGAVLTDSTDKNYDVNQDGRIDIGDVADVIDATIQPAAWDGVQEVNVGDDVYSFRMIPIKPGTFTMGSPNTEMGRGTNEGPQHEVTITKEYWIAETQVTQDLWQLVMGNNPSANRSLYTKHPVENVSWNDCQEFIANLNEITGKKFRLPTEAEWEFAARGGTLSKGYKFAGSNNQKEVAWYVSNSNGTTQPVAQLRPNELGIFDMSGNVAEWVNDWYGRYPSAPVTDPIGPASGSFRVYRNGGYSDKAANVRCGFRYMQSVTYKQPFIGLRLALDA